MVVLRQGPYRLEVIRQSNYGIDREWMRLHDRRKSLRIGIQIGFLAHFGRTLRFG
jgi:hypothetical protein